MGQESAIQIQLVHGGFILQTYDNGTDRTEVFTSQGKLMKAIRSAIEANSLVGKAKDDSESSAD